MVGFKVKFYWYQIGSGDFLHAFFSTVAYNLENMKWGSRFPVIMKELYQGHLPKEHVDAAIGELAVISAELRDLSPDRVIWDIEDLSKQIPEKEFQKCPFIIIGIFVIGLIDRG